jgi:glycosyltransferase involved in cell wall biosynthesis
MFDVSIIIPTYNRADIIEFTLDSIAMQSLSQEKFEVIVVDDCSTDNTFNILKKYKKIKNFRVEKLPENSGFPSVPRNRGIELATGKYVMFVDSDDIITQFSLEEMSNMANKSNSDFILLYPFPAGRKKFTERYINLYNNIEPVLIENDKNMSHILFTNVTIFNFYKRQKLIESGLRFANLGLNEDLLFNRFFWTLTEKAGVIGSKKACYFLPPKRSDSFSITSDKTAMLENVLSETFKNAISLKIDDKKRLRTVVNNIIMVFLGNNLDKLTNNFCKQFSKKEYVNFIEKNLFTDFDNLHEITQIFLDKVVENFDR